MPGQSILDLADITAALAAVDLPPASAVVSHGTLAVAFPGPGKAMAWAAALSARLAAESTATAGAPELAGSRVLAVMAHATGSGGLRCRYCRTPLLPQGLRPDWADPTPRDHPALFCPGRLPRSGGLPLHEPVLIVVFPGVTVTGDQR
jgi:hypothetical protein